MEIDPIEICPATVEDVPTIRDFIHQLAVFEKLEEQMVATNEILSSSLFPTDGSPAAAQVILAKINGKSVAFALYFYSFSTWTGKRGLYLEDLYVEPNHRAKGVGLITFLTKGKKLLKELAKIAVDKDCTRFEWYSFAF
jgi:GNAT superfamily N-acetyltransferase